MPFFDETFDEEQSRERLENFYGQFSADVRKKLISKNVKKPENLYDVLYGPIRRELLSKNIPSQIKIDETSTEIRNGLLAKQIGKDIDLDKSGENIRKSLLSKNDLIQSTLNMEKVADSSRKSLVSKNTPNKNAGPEVGSDVIRHNLESKNTPSNVNLDANASAVRNSLLSKNDPNNDNLDSTSLHQRESLLSKNTPNNKNIDTTAGQVRNDLISKNVGNNNDLDKTSSVTRENLLSKNKDDHKTIDEVGNQVRQDQLSSNVPNGKTIDTISDSFRSDLASKNKSAPSTLDSTGDRTRNNLLSKNTPTKTNIDSVAGSARPDLLSQNQPNSNNIDKNSESFRNSLLSQNVNSPNNLDKNSDQFRTDLVASNKPTGANPETAAQSARESLLSSNKPNGVDLDKQGQAFRDSLKSNNVPNGANPEEGAGSVRDKLLSGNVPNGANPENGSVAVRNKLLAGNVPNGANPEDGANYIRNTLTSSNVPTGANPETGAGTLRDDLLSSNVPTGANPETGADDIRNVLISKNDPSTANIDDTADPARGNLISKNVPNGANPEDGADQVRDDLLSSNIPSNKSIDLIANPVRGDLLSKNVPNGANPDADALQARNDLLSKNGPVESTLDSTADTFRHQLLSKNGSDTPLGANIILPNGTSQFMGISNLDVLGEITRQSNKLRDSIFTNNTGANLQKFYGTDVKPDGFTPLATITSAAQLHNIENNTFSLHRYSQGSSAGLETLTRNNNDGFQDLISKTIGSFQKYTQIGTNSTPPSVIQANQGQYLQKGAEEMLRPIAGPLGSATSMMSQTEPSDLIEKNFNRAERGVRHIINTIKKSNVALAKNYDPQNNRSFIIGTSDNNGPKRAFGRFTVANPYALPKDTGVMELRLTNYAIKGGGTRTMSFPPYVKSFTNTDDANWTDTLFLGRPEAIYTYSNSKRSGTLEFMVLTDYAQSVDIGVDFEQAQTLTETFDKHFTDESNKSSKKKDLESKIQKEKKKLNELKQKRSQSQGSGQDVGGMASLDLQIAAEQSAIDAMQAQITQLDASADGGSSRLFAEGSKDAGNIYQSVLDGTREIDAIDGTITSHPADTRSKLAQMKEKLLFQPAFFSGDKVDFLRRLEFIAKLTRPSRNENGNGFSFTNPPVCHLHLGSWINNDIIISSVNYNYEDAPWTFDGDRVQPMWVNVTLSFNIIGTYGGIPTENVPLATDTGGFFQRKISS